MKEINDSLAGIIKQLIEIRKVLHIVILIPIAFSVGFISNYVWGVFLGLFQIIFGEYFNDRNTQ